MESVRRWVFFLDITKGRKIGWKRNKKKPIFLNTFWLVCFRWQVNRSWASQGWCSSLNPADPGRFYRKHEGKLPRASFFRYLLIPSQLLTYLKVSLFSIAYFFFIKKTRCSDPAPFCALRSQQSCKSLSTPAMVYGWKEIPTFFRVKFMYCTLPSFTRMDVLLHLGNSQMTELGRHPIYNS